ncbi:MAG: sodium-dependent transporter, partial [Acidobacteria bacterium]|nr:sodium-dependent transporter [Acidobacteriota bacterium]
AMALAAVVVWFGVRGIERVAKILIPTLFVLVIILAARAVTLPGATAGLEFLFKPDWGELLTSPTIWLAALTQNAWDTGAGWGLVLTYAIYMRAKEDVSLNAFLIGFGNNSVSLLAGIMVLCTIFSINPAASAEIVGAGNEGLTFVWMPQLFAQMPAGQFFMAIFFLALAFAALTSQISLLELATRVLIDGGFSRPGALFVAAGAGLVFGSFSALHMGIFSNQDWVWGVGLMLSGFFFALAALRFGLERMRKKVVNGEGCDLKVGYWWTFLVGVVVPLEAVVLMVWWLVQARQWDPEGYLDPLAPTSVGTVLAQWGVALLLLILANVWLARRLAAREPAEEVS